jgi:translation initiation factor 3 subunit D
MLEEIEFHRLAKLRLEVDDPQDLFVYNLLSLAFWPNSFYSDTYGRLFPYDKSYDRVTTKTERPLQLVDRIKYNTTTSDDPVIQAVRFCPLQFIALF